MGKCFDLLILINHLCEDEKEHYHLVPRLTGDQLYKTALSTLVYGTQITSAPLPVSSHFSSNVQRFVILSFVYCFMSLDP